MTAHIRQVPGASDPGQVVRRTIRADLAVVETLALDPEGPLGARAATTGSAGGPAVSLAMLLITAAERVRCDPPTNFNHCAVRGAAQVLLDRLEERMARWGSEQQRQGRGPRRMGVDHRTSITNGLTWEEP